MSADEYFSNAAAAAAAAAADASFDKTALNAVGRHKERGAYDKETIMSIVKEARVLHLGFIDDEGLPQCVPMIGAIEQEPDGEMYLYFHGYPSARFIKLLRDIGTRIVATATIVDGYVLAPSVFGHSMNYRSAVLHGVSLPYNQTQDGDESAYKMRVFQLVVDSTTPGRWEHSRQPTDAELKGTAVIRMKVETASAKIRTGPPGKLEKADLENPELMSRVWTGVVPIKRTLGTPEPAEFCATRTVPDHVFNLVP